MGLSERGSHFALVASPAATSDVYKIPKFPGFRHYKNLSDYFLTTFFGLAMLPGGSYSRLFFSQQYAVHDYQRRLLSGCRNQRVYRSQGAYQRRSAGIHEPEHGLHRHRDLRSGFRYTGKGINSKNRGQLLPALHSLLQSQSYLADRVDTKTLSVRQGFT